MNELFRKKYFSVTRIRHCPSFQSKSWFKNQRQKDQSTPLHFSVCTDDTGQNLVIRSGSRQCHLARTIDVLQMKSSTTITQLQHLLGITTFQPMTYFNDIISYFTVTVLHTAYVTLLNLLGIATLQPMTYSTTKILHFTVSVTALQSMRSHCIRHTSVYSGSQRSSQ